MAGGAPGELEERRGELIAHEHDINRLVADRGVRALCRYPVREGGGVLHEILRLYRRDVIDDLWQATVVAGRLLVQGEIEASNVDRFDGVVRAGAVTAGASTVDLSGSAAPAARAPRSLSSAMWTRYAPSVVVLGGALMAAGMS